MIRWGLKADLNIDAARQKTLGISNMLPQLKTSCSNHELFRLYPLPMQGRQGLEAGFRLDRGGQQRAGPAGEDQCRQVCAGKGHHHFGHAAVSQALSQ